MKTKTKKEQAPAEGVGVDIKVKNADLGVVSAVYSKIQFIEFADAELALKMVREKKRVDQASDDFEVIRKQIVDKYGIKQGAKISNEDMTKANEEFVKFAEGVTEIKNLTPIPFDVLRGAGLSPKQLSVLEDLGLLSGVPEGL